MSRKLLGMLLSLSVLANVVLSAPSAHATYSVYLYQNGNNVDATGSGTIEQPSTISRGIQGLSIGNRLSSAICSPS